MGPPLPYSKKKKKKRKREIKKNSFLNAKLHTFMAQFRRGMPKTG
jgi:hypothetical protein